MKRVLLVTSFRIYDRFHERRLLSNKKITKLYQSVFFLTDVCHCQSASLERLQGNSWKIKTGTTYQNVKNPSSIDLRSFYIFLQISKSLPIFKLIKIQNLSTNVYHKCIPRLIDAKHMHID